MYSDYQDLILDYAERVSMLKRLRLAGLWHHPDFLKFWAGQTVSLFGSQISILALPLTAVLVLKATAFQMGVLTALGAVPALLFGLIVGVWVDRLPKRSILIVTDTGRFIPLSLIPLAYPLGFWCMGMLYLLAFLVATVTIVFSVAYRSYLRALIEGDQLLE